MDHELVDPVEVAGWYFVIGDQPSEDLPDIAADALVRGLDTPALRELAGQSRTDVRESAELFGVVLQELGFFVSDEQEVLWRLVRWIAGRMLHGDIEPYTGASRIWSLSPDIDDGGDLRIFVGLASEWDDHPEGRVEIEQEMVSASKELLDRDKPRTWIQVRALPEQSPITVWRNSDGAIPVDLASLPISSQLVSGLLAWAGDYDAIFSDVAADASGFETQADAEAFVERGKKLKDEIQDELGAHWVVEYWPEPVRPPGLRLRNA